MRLFKRNRGNITIILIGLVSVMLFLTATLSKRMSGHARLLTLSDYTQITRYFLESYAGDIMMQIRKQANSSDPSDKKLFEFFRKNLPKEGSSAYKNLERKNNFKLVDYRMSDMLVELKENLGIEIPKDPELRFVKPRALGYPDFIVPPDKYARTEKRGDIEIVCYARFKKKDYRLTIQFPFTVVFKMIPILKDFAFFADNAAQEQKRIIGGNSSFFNRSTPPYNWSGDYDGLNLMFTRNSRFPTGYEVSSNEGEKFPVFDSSFKMFKHQRPWIFLPPINFYNDPKRNGKIYLGPSDKDIFLNLADVNIETSDESGFKYRRDKGELFAMWPEYFKFDKLPTKRPLFQSTSGKKSGSSLVFEIDLQYNSANMAIAGFGYRLYPYNNDALFSTTNYQYKYLLNSPSGNAEDLYVDSGSDGGAGCYAWEKIKNGQSDLSKNSAKVLALSSGLKFLDVLPADQVGQNVRGANREVYGKVWGRGFIFTFFYTPSGGGFPLRYYPDPPPGFEPYIEVYGKKTYTFKPKDGEYKNYMSRIVSGLENSNNFNYLDSEDCARNGMLPLNNTYPSDPNSKIKPERKILISKNYTGADGFGFKKTSRNEPYLDRIGNEYICINKNLKITDKKLSSLQSRIGRIFSSGDEFKEYAGHSDDAYKSGFRVGGVVYVNGDLDLSKGILADSEDIEGGVVIVNGNITLGDITRGFNKASIKGLKLYETRKKIDDFALKNINHKNMLTFVCAAKDSSKDRKGIQVVGDTILGAHLVHLAFKERKGYEFYNYDQISWAKVPRSSRIIFVGAIAVNRPGLWKRLKEFGKNKDDDYDSPIFIYAPTMSDGEPSLSVQVNDFMKSYELTAGKF